MDMSSFLAGTADTVRALVTLLTTAVTVLLGAWFMYQGLSKMIAHAHGHRHGQPTVGPVLINLGLGAVLVQVTFMIDRLVETIFGSSREDPNSAMSYMPEQITQSEMLSQLVNAGILWVWAIGFVAIVRGLVLWNDLADGQRGQGNGWKGFWHIFFGALSVNLPGVFKMFAN